MKTTRVWEQFFYVFAGMARSYSTRRPSWVERAMPAMVLWMSFGDADQLMHQFKRSRLHADSVAITRQLLLHLSSCAAAGNAMTDIPRLAGIQNMMFFLCAVIRIAAGIGMKALLVSGSKVYEG